MTFVIAPKVTVKNIAIYDTTVPVEISDRTFIEIETPDGSKTILKKIKAASGLYRRNNEYRGFCGMKLEQ